MKESEDKLTQQIKAVFEDYDDGLAENGWAALREKYPEKKNKKLPIWWLTGAAATLLVVAGLYFNRTFNTEKVILRAKTEQKDTLLNPELENSKADIEIAAVQKVIPEENKGADSQVQKSDNSGKGLLPENQLIVKQKEPIAVEQKQKSDGLTSGAIDHRIKDVKAVELNTALAVTNNSNTDKNTGENNTITTKIDEKPVEEKVNKLTTEEFLTQQTKLLTAQENKKDIKKKAASKTTLDVFTGTFFNYHDDNEAKLSAGVGLNANVKVTKNLVFSFGAGVSQNKVSFDNNVPTQVASAMFTSRDNALNAAPVSGAAYSATATNDLSFNGSMLSIDLPMVVKLYPTNKQDFYISTGINSSTYLSQKYTYNYSVSNFAVQNGTAQQQQQIEKSNLKGFDFANSAIIAIGINQNIGKNILIFEPYYKPALGTMGDKNLRISSAGLNLKFNFNGNPKK